MFFEPRSVTMNADQLEVGAQALDVRIQADLERVKLDTCQVRGRSIAVQAFQRRHAGQFRCYSSSALKHKTP